MRLHPIEATAEWAAVRSPLTPYHFHEGIAYTLAACAIAGRVYVQMPHERIYPNLYTLLLGQTGVFAKSVAMGLADELANATGLTDRVIGSVFTPEAILNELSGKKPNRFKKLAPDVQQQWEAGQAWGARRMFRLDEAGRFYNGLERDYQAGMIDIWMSLYDCRPLARSSVSHGLTATGETCVSCLFATTPSSIRRMLSNRNLWGAGFWPRFNIHFETAFTEFKEAEHVAPPADVLTAYQQLGNIRLTPHSSPGQQLAVTIEREVVREHNKMLERIRRDIFDDTVDEICRGYLVRLHTKRIKLALIRALFDWPHHPNPPVVTMEHWQATAKSAERMKTDLTTLLEALQQTECATLQERIIAALQTKNGLARPRELQRSLHVTKAQLLEALKPLFDLREITWQGGKTGVLLELLADPTKPPSPPAC